MTHEFTPEARQELVEYLKTHELPKGLGTRESACSVAAINLAITGELTDEVPECMSLVLGLTVITLQDVMPNDLRNSVRYKTLLPDMAGTGRQSERYRADLIINWMWDTVLPELQSFADYMGFGTTWREMYERKTADAAARAARAADAAARARDATRATAHAARTARATAHAARTARAAALAARARAADTDAARAARAAVRAARAARAADTDADFWKTVDPIGMLERMTYLKLIREAT